jgi:hypothetical protein
MRLSERDFRITLNSLGSDVASALRQIEIARVNGYYCGQDCDRLARVVASGFVARNVGTWDSLRADWTV